MAAAIENADRLNASCAVAAPTPKSSWIAGSAGRNTCMAKGPRAVAATSTAMKRKVGAGTAVTPLADMVAPPALASLAPAPSRYQFGTTSPYTEGADGPHRERRVQAHLFLCPREFVGFRWGTHRGVASPAYLAPHRCTNRMHVVALQRGA